MAIEHLSVLVVGGETHADRIVAYLINYFIRRKDAISHIID